MYVFSKYHTFEVKNITLIVKMFYNLSLIICKSSKDHSCVKHLNNKLTRPDSFIPYFYFIFVFY